jgi:hypothetical protein
VTRWSARFPGDSRVLAVAIALAALVAGLTRTPPGAETDTVFVETAVQLARDGADRSGRERPLMVQGADGQWLQPLPVHLASAFVRTGLEPGIAARLVASTAWAVSVWLVYLVGVRLFVKPRAAVLAAALFAATPAGLTLAASGGAALTALPPLLAWFAAVASCLERPRRDVLALGAAALGLGVYTQPAGVLMAPIFLTTGLAALATRHREPALHLSAVTGLVVTLVPLVVWYWQHPGTWVETMGRWAVHLAHIRDPFQGLVAFARWDVAGRRASDYWHYFSPVYLFLTGTVFAAAVAALLPVGLAGCGDRMRRDGWWLVVMAWIAAPLAAALLDAPRSIALAVALLPIGALLAAGGVERLLATRTSVGAVTAWSLAALAVVEGLLRW